MKHFDDLEQKWFIAAVIGVVIIGRALTMAPDFNFKQDRAVIKFIGGLLFVFSFGFLYWIFSR